MDNQSLSPSQAQVSESSFISKVFLWMAGGLCVSAVASVFLLSQPDLLRLILGNRLIFWGLIIAEIGIVIWLTAALPRLSAAMASSLFLVYSFLNGMTFTPILLMYTGSSVALTFGVTAGTFFFFSLYGITTKKDLTSVGSLCFMGLIGIILASLVNIFLKSPIVYWVSTYIGIAVFLGLIAYDTQKLKALHARAANSETEGKLAVIGALALYLDFINLFLLLLRIFGNRRN